MAHRQGGEGGRGCATHSCSCCPCAGVCCPPPRRCSCPAHIDNVGEGLFKPTAQLKHIAQPLRRLAQRADRLLDDDAALRETLNHLQRERSPGGAGKQGSRTGKQTRPVTTCWVSVRRPSTPAAATRGAPCCGALHAAPCAVERGARAAAQPRRAMPCMQIQLFNSHQNTLHAALMRPESPQHSWIARRAPAKCCFCGYCCARKSGRARAGRPAAPASHLRQCNRRNLHPVSHAVGPRWLLLAG